MEGRIDMVDLISALPEPILHHIMSFMPFEEAVQTSILSKRWKQVWDTYPNLEFTDVCYNISKKMETLKYMEQILQKRLREMVSVKKLTFRMEMSNYPELASFIDRSFCYAVGCNVKELKLEIVYWGCVWWYKLPESVFCASSITVLDLEGCKLEFRGSNVNLPSLRNLLLKQVKVEDRVIDSLVARCPLIEYLRIDECEGFKSLELFSVSRVDKIEVHHNCELERMDINAVNTHSIAIFVQSICAINIAPCSNLKRLKLDMVTMADERFSNQISELPLLEYLSISECDELEIIKISNPCLEKLLIFRCADLVEVRIEAPKLNTFKYMGDTISVSSNALALSETDLYFYSDNMDSDWLITYIELLSKFHQFSKVMNLQSYIGENVIIPTEVRELLQPPLSGIKHLNFTIHVEDSDFPIAKLLDGLLWISSHLETLSLEYKNHFCDKFSFQFSYKNQITYEGGTPRCCQSLPVLCWQDCMKKVEVEHIVCKRTKNKVKYTFEGEGIWEEINGLCRYKI